MPLRRRIYLDPERVGIRADEFPIIRELLGERVEDVLNGKLRRADSAPLLLRLLERTGEGSLAMLQLFTEGISFFNDRNPPGWREWRGSLPGLDRVSLLSRYFELLVAMWFEASGHEVEEFEPTGAPGRKADLLVGYAGERALVEATSPGPHSTDWIEDAMDRLTFGLSRVESGLVIEVDGYQSLTMDPPRGWRENPPVAVQQQDDLISAFARGAEKLDLDQLPQVVIAASAEQPVTITAVASRSEIADGTDVIASWSRSGIAPNTERLVEKILEERRHLPGDQPSLILVDLSRWQDFRNADYYLRDVAKRIAGRVSPAVFVGTCVGTHVDGRHGLIERGVLARDEVWRLTRLGGHFAQRWGGVDYTPLQ